MSKQITTDEAFSLMTAGKEVLGCLGYIFRIKNNKLQCAAPLSNGVWHDSNAKMARELYDNWWTMDEPRPRTSNDKLVNECLALVDAWAIYRNSGESFALADSVKKIKSLLERCGET